MAPATFNNILNPYKELLKQAPFLIKINDESGHAVALEFLDALMTNIGDNPENSLWPLFEMVSKAVTHYEAIMYPETIRELEKHQGTLPTLRILIDQYQLQLSDLPEIGNQQVVSDTLNGKRELTLEQIQRLANRFDLPVSLFVA
jgi:HTH-type transcriptional regulator/antitoxin HigA